MWESFDKWSVQRLCQSMQNHVQWMLFKQTKQTIFKLVPVRFDKRIVWRLDGSMRKHLQLTDATHPLLKTLSFSVAVATRASPLCQRCDECDVMRCDGCDTMQWMWCDAMWCYGCDVMRWMWCMRCDTRDVMRCYVMDPYVMAVMWCDECDVMHYALCHDSM